MKNKKINKREISVVFAKSLLFLNEYKQGCSPQLSTQKLLSSVT